MATKKPSKYRYPNKAPPKIPPGNQRIIDTLQEAHRLRFSSELRFSERYASEIAFDVLKPRSLADLDAPLKAVMLIFYKWNAAHGSGGASAAEGKAPWECRGSHIKTPIGLFWSLLGDEYQPLLDFLVDDDEKLERTAALLIIVSQEWAQKDAGVNPAAYKIKRGEWIEGALLLSRMRLSRISAQVEKLKPLAKKGASFSKGTAAARAKQEEKLRRVERAREKCIADKVKLSPLHIYQRMIDEDRRLIPKKTLYRLLELLAPSVKGQ